MRIGIDIGGSKISAVALDQNNCVINRTRCSTPSEPGQVYKSVGKLVRKLAGQVDVTNYTVGIGMPGSVDRLTYILQDTDPVTEFRQIFPNGVKIENDANCFALAESRLGAAQGASSVFGVIIGTGVGGGLVINDKLHRGANSLAGEWGHNTIELDGETCWCGNVGCVETLLSGRALEKNYFNLSGEHKLSRQIFASHDKYAIFLVNEYYKNFGHAIASIINVVDPEVIVIGGGLSNQQGLYDRGVESIKRSVFSRNFNTKIVRAQLGDDSGVIGAALL